MNNVTFYLYLVLRFYIVLSERNKFISSTQASLNFILKEHII